MLKPEFVCEKVKLQIQYNIYVEQMAIHCSSLTPK